jgi:hypothetical protein
MGMKGLQFKASSRPKSWQNTYLKKKKNWVWWYTSVIPAMQEAEVGSQYQIVSEK